MAGLSLDQYMELLKKAMPAASGTGGGMKGARQDRQASVLRDYRAGKPIPDDMRYKPPPPVQLPEHQLKADTLANLVAVAGKLNQPQSQRRQVGQSYQNPYVQNLMDIGVRQQSSLRQPAPQQMPMHQLPQGMGNPSSQTYGLMNLDRIMRMRGRR